MEIFYLHTPKTLRFDGRAIDSNLDECLRTGANNLVVLICIFQVHFVDKGRCLNCPPSRYDAHLA
jgi:hypothetical protein